MRDQILTETAMALTAKTARPEVVVRVHVFDDWDACYANEDPDELRSMCPVHVDRSSDMAVADDADHLYAMATEWWQTTPDSERLEVYEIFGPYEVGSRIEFDAMVHPEHPMSWVHRKVQQYQDDAPRYVSMSELRAYENRLMEEYGL